MSLAETNPDNTEHRAEQLRLAMRRMASSVSVITSADHAKKPFAMTATAITSLSMEPPTLLICVNQWADVRTAIADSSAFCVSILHNRQKAIAEQCSARELEEGYLTQAPWQQDKSGIPYLPDSLACVFCALERTIEYSTHSIFLGVVDRVLLRNDIEPLIYFDGQYHRHGSPILD